MDRYSSLLMAVVPRVDRYKIMCLLDCAVLWEILWWFNSCLSQKSWVIHNILLTRKQSRTRVGRKCRSDKLAGFSEIIWAFLDPQISGICIWFVCSPFILVIVAHCVKYPQVDLNRPLIQFRLSYVPSTDNGSGCLIFLFSLPVSAGFHLSPSAGLSLWLGCNWQFTLHPPGPPQLHFQSAILLFPLAIGGSLLRFHLLLIKFVAGLSGHNVTESSRKKETLMQSVPIFRLSLC